MKRNYFIVCLLFGCWLSSFGMGYQKAGNRNLIVSFLEIKGKNTGWGLAVVIQTPEGRTYLYDTGPGQYPNANFDEGKDMIAPFLKRNNIKVIDGIIISHPHKDHFGGLKYLMGSFKVKALYDTGYSGCINCEPEYDDYKSEYIAKGGRYQRIKQGDKLGWDKYLEVEVLSPPPGFLKDEDEANVNSAVVRIKYKKNTFLLTGDIPQAGQEYLLKHFNARDLQATVLSAPHHGYDSYLPFAEVVKPKILVASSLNGAEEPALKAREVFSKVGSEVYATCWNGTVEVVCDGNKCTVQTERNDNPYVLPGIVPSKHSSSGFLPPGWINLHDKKYATPTDGTISGGGRDATSAIMRALADVPLGGTLLMGPYVYQISGANGIDLSSRLDVHIEGAGGGMGGNHDQYNGTYIKVTGKNNAFTISPSTQGQQGPTFSKIHVYDGSGESTGWYVKNCNKSQWNRCSVVNANKGWVFTATNAPDWDNAWHVLYDITTFHCHYGLWLGGNFGISVFGADIDVAGDSGCGLFLSNYAQNNKFYNVMIDGSTVGGIGTGTGIEVDSTGAHDNEFFGLKAEGLRTTVKLRSPSPGGGRYPTTAIKFFGGSMSGYAGTEQMVDIGANVGRTLIDNVAFTNSDNYTLMVSDKGWNTKWIYADDDAQFTDSFAATYMPSNLHKGRTKVVTMTGNISSVASMPGGYKGARSRIIFVQDATGGHSLPAAASWTGYYMDRISNTNNKALKKTTFDFEYDGTKWIQVSAANTWF